MHLEQTFEKTRSHKAQKRVLRRLRAHRVRLLWSDARRLAPTIETGEIARWFGAAFGNDWIERRHDSETPRRTLMRTLIWLIEARDQHRYRRDLYEITRINAAIWRTVTEIKGLSL